ncbi:uromodulin-like [Chanos chanos]|uniref:Uromodulin-like n=1 Tax=Chanos chanos TaxID=29144 RepID=A0A6J2VWX8_CHACN|nr:uromodulin-like [Chanos chanos]
MPDWCVDQYRCGTNIPLWLTSPHPQPEDGVVTRQVCGHWSNNCCYYQSNPIRVKACPGNYYVYEFVNPTVCSSAYCSAIANPSPDPCLNYTSLNDTWRATNYSDSTIRCDQSRVWSGWYRLFYQGVSVQMPDWCVNQYRCGTHIPLWLTSPHPQPQDGVVTRQVCGHWSNNCCYYQYNSIRVKGCPGNYYVYEFVRPTSCSSAYCSGNLMNILSDL